MQCLDPEFPVVGTQLTNERNEIRQVVDLCDQRKRGRVDRSANLQVNVPIL
jgi:hypothetical protein